MADTSSALKEFNDRYGTTSMPEWSRKQRPLGTSVPSSGDNDYADRFYHSYRNARETHMASALGAVLPSFLLPIAAESTSIRHASASDVILDEGYTGYNQYHIGAGYSPGHSPSEWPQHELYSKWLKETSAKFNAEKEALLAKNPNLNAMQLWQGLSDDFYNNYDNTYNWTINHYKAQTEKLRKKELAITKSKSNMAAGMAAGRGGVNGTYTAQTGAVATVATVDNSMPRARRSLLGDDVTGSTTLLGGR